MKKLAMAVVLTAMLVTGACSKSDDSGGSSGGTTASTPQPCTGTNGSCQTQTPTTQFYQNYGWCQQGNPNCSMNGWYFLPNYTYSANTCGNACPNGTVLTYGPYGYACAPFTNYYARWTWRPWSAGLYGYAWWNVPQNGQMWQNNQQQTYYAPQATACGSARIAQGCDVRLNNCSGAYPRCQPVSGGSTIGLCVQ